MVAEVVEARRGGEVGCPQVARAAGRVHLARKHVGHGAEADGPREADLQDGVRLAGAAGLHQRANLHRGGNVKEHDHLRARGLHGGKKLQLLPAELQLVLTGRVVGGLGVGHKDVRGAGLEALQQVLAEVGALARRAADDDHAHGAGKALDNGRRVH